MVNVGYKRLLINGVRRDLGLGGWPTVTLEEAKAKALENRRLLREGQDPLALKRKGKLPTFRTAAQKTYDTLRPRWRSDKVAQNW